MTAAAAILPDEPFDTVTAGELAEYVGHHIRFYRKAAGLSGEALARVVGRHHGTVYLWEKGEGLVPLAELLKISAALGLPLSAFLPRGGDA